MSAGLYELIPGLNEAEENYAASNLEAFVGIEPKLVGKIEVVPLTPQIFIELDYAKNRFLDPEAFPEAEDLAAFVWRVSPCYRRGDEETRKAFSALLFLVILEHGEDAIAADVYAYLTRALMGIPVLRNRSVGQRSLSSWPSHLVHIMAKNYGWTEEYILNLPYRRLWQYSNRIMEDVNPKFREVCAKALQLRQRYLERVNQN